VRGVQQLFKGKRRLHVVQAAPAAGVLRYYYASSKDTKNPFLSFY